MVLPHDALCPTNPSHPEPIGYCDRCNRRVYLSNLVWQFDWTGANLTNRFLRVCTGVPNPCLDVPNEQARTIWVGPDPVPLRDPRPGYIQSQEAATGVPPIPPYVIDDDT